MRAASGFPDREKDREKQKQRRSISLARRCAAAAGLLLLLSLAVAHPRATRPRRQGQHTADDSGHGVCAATGSPIYLGGLGSVEPSYRQRKSRVDGQLVESNSAKANSAKRDLLAVIDPRPYQALLDEAQAQLFRDQASLRDAQLNYTRDQSLFKDSGAVSQQQVDTQKAAADQLVGTVRNDQALVDNARLNLSYCHITAPESGRVGLRLVDPGNMVHATDANPLLVITQLQPITVIFTCPRTNCRRGAAHAKSPLPVDAYSRDDQTNHQRQAADHRQ
jgi:multidrug efflux system membrane fusion protein